MRVRGHSHEAPPADGAAALERFEARDVDELLGFLVRRTGDAQLAADVTAETFAAALIAHHRSGPDDAPSAASLRRIALERLADAQRRGFVDTSARRRLGMTRIELAADEIVRIEARGEGRAATLWAGHPAPEAAEAPDAVVAGGVGARPDFATRLLAQLGEAAPRAERSGGRTGTRALGPLARFAPRGRGRAAAAALAGLLVLGALAAVIWSVTGSGTAPARGPRVVATVAMADALGRTAEVAFGSVWLSATNDAAVLRIDPATRRVTARIPVGTDVNIGAGAGAIWAVPRRPSVTQTRLIRIDPRTNRVAARIPIPSPGGRYPLFGASVVAGPRVWVVGAMGLVAVDPARDRPAREVVLGGDFLVVDSLLRGNELWISRADRSITRFDAASGRRLGRLGWPAPTSFLVPDGDRVVAGARRSVALVDPAGGRASWRTRLGTQLNAAALVGGRLLVEGANGASSRDRLWELDPRTGRVLGAVTVPGFSVNAMLRVGGEAWLVTADGHVIAVAP